jgi:hypothetical protein
MLSGMLPQDDHQAPADGETQVRDPVIEALTAVGSATESSVSWHLSPGYSTHLHAYELAMLPIDASDRLAHGRR